MIKINKKGSIFISKNDNAYIKINTVGYKIQDGDTIRFSVKRSFNDITPIIEVDMHSENESEFVILSLSKEQLNQLDFGEYYYDIRIIYANGTVYTPELPNPFVVKEVVGRV